MEASFLSWLLKIMGWFPGLVAADSESEFYFYIYFGLVGLYIHSLRQKNLLESFTYPRMEGGLLWTGVFQLTADSFAEAGL